MESFISLARPIAMISGGLIIASVAVEFTAVNTHEAMGRGIRSEWACSGRRFRVARRLSRPLRRTVVGLRATCRVGIPVALLGATSTAGGVWSHVIVVPGLAQAAPEVLESRGLTTLLIGFVLSYAVLGLGGLIFGIAILRSAVFPRWTSILMIVGAVLRSAAGAIPDSGCGGQPDGWTAEVSGHLDPAPAQPANA